MRLGTKNGKEVCHLLEWIGGRTIKQVVRSTFTGEGQGLVQTADMCIALSITMQEIKQGPLAHRMAARLTEEGGLVVKVILCTDALNIVKALEADHVKPPAEKSFMCRLLWLREKILNGVIHELRWLNTRDVTADGHTKGSMSREAILNLLQGVIHQRHPH